MMSALHVRRVAFALLCTLPAILAQEYQIPDVTIQALKPKGIRLSIPDAPGTNLFVFHGHVNRDITRPKVGSIAAEVDEPDQNGLWSYQNDNVALKVGDVINYYVQVSNNRKGYIRDNLSYRVTELVDPSGSPAPVPLTPSVAGVSTSGQPSGDCRPTATEVGNRKVCSGEIIFEEDFLTLKEDIWQIEQYLPSGPEYPFVSYQRPDRGPMVSVADGVLRIEPKLQSALPGFDADSIISNNKLDLTSGCTRKDFCVHINQGSQIMPPIASGRITSNTFAFKYGIVEIKAKLPVGDWLYPEILLEPVMSKYGPDKYASGILRIAGSRGNAVLQSAGDDLSNKVLYGGPIMDFKCRTNLLHKKSSTSAWGDDFHVYSLRWAPDRITLLVDGQEWGRIEPAASGLQGRLPQDKCEPPRMLLKDTMAPFDNFFRIALGVSAGGLSEFPDRATTQNSNSKPWLDSASKARVNFLKDEESWIPTWSQPALLVEYVKIRAL